MDYYNNWHENEGYFIVVDEDRSGYVVRKGLPIYTSKIKTIFAIEDDQRSLWNSLITH